ncbi:unnamed protein product [Protopolystoma xenopodis]|uniref:Uncharacterized protein n=1 Tax=Protopolystoma xenopodis TaxID=117903 RepID=A0A448WGV3_9PLAT|nr:unnamed protein product [Protopolystoma xenopodis]
MGKTVSPFSSSLSEVGARDSGITVSNSDESQPSNLYRMDYPPRLPLNLSFEISARFFAGASGVEIHASMEGSSTSALIPGPREKLSARSVGPGISTLKDVYE